ncbi:MAG TPA: aminopeptidase P family protein [Acidimicrobiales bacterium]|nr:aminopeptidase P family protein [Acidimicrobiales bacterium]
MIDTPHSSEPDLNPPPVTPPALVEFMSGNWADLESAVTKPIAAAPFHALRRRAVRDAFPGEWLVIPTGPLKVRANDTDYRFRAGTDFAWLTGFQEPDAVLVLSPEGETLYARPRRDRKSPAFFTDRRYGELWVGPQLGLDEVGTMLAIDTAPIDELEAAIKRAEGAPVRVRRGFDARVEAMVPLPKSSDAAEAAADADAELASVMSDLRLLKDKHEVACLQAAVDATIIGFEDVVRALPEAVRQSERWVEGTFNRRARTEGNDVGYDTIAACGEHACTLHWVRNDGEVRRKDLLLLDAGVEGPELYTADVTRTLPVSGRFSAAQREVYEVVWRAQQAGFKACRPGQPFLAPHRAAMRVLTEWLVDKGILKTSVDDALDDEHKYHVRYTLHGTSHMLGLDVHDCADSRDDYRDATLAPGMVLTVEPGCYFQPDDLTVPKRYRGIGVRIEDDVLITKRGHRVLSAALPTEAGAVEAWMAKLRPRPRR